MIPYIIAGAIGYGIAKLVEKDTKKYAEGGLSGIANTANSLMGEVDGMANSIKYGSGAGSSDASIATTKNYTVIGNVP